MSGKQDCGSVVVKLEYLLFEVVGIHWVETGEGLVENHKRRTVYNRADELYFLSHTFERGLQSSYWPIRQDSYGAATFGLNPCIARSHPPSTDRDTRYDR